LTNLVPWLINVIVGNEIFITQKPYPGGPIDIAIKVLSQAFTHLNLDCDD